MLAPSDIYYHIIPENQCQHLFIISLLLFIVFHERISIISSSLTNIIDYLIAYLLVYFKM